MSKSDDLDFEVVVDPVLEAEEADAKAFCVGYEGAKESGMEREYVMWVLRALKQGSSMSESIYEAYWEWDL